MYTQVDTGGVAIMLFVSGVWARRNFREDECHRRTSIHQQCESSIASGSNREGVACEESRWPRKLPQVIVATVTWCMSGRMLCAPREVEPVVTRVPSLRSLHTLDILFCFKFPCECFTP
jgi:hypothetical protein